MKTLYQLVEDKPTIVEQATEIKNQREEISKILEYQDLIYTEKNLTSIRSLLKEDFGIEEVVRAYYLAI